MNPQIDTVRTLYASVIWYRYIPTYSYVLSTFWASYQKRPDSKNVLAFSRSKDNRFWMSKQCVRPSACRWHLASLAKLICCSLPRLSLELLKIPAAGEICNNAVLILTCWQLAWRTLAELSVFLSGCLSFWSRIFKGTERQTDRQTDRQARTDMSKTSRRNMIFGKLSRGEVKEWAELLLFLFLAARPRYASCFKMLWYMYFYI